MDISVIICTYNRSHMLEKVLEDLQGLNDSPHITWETLIVDNNSTDETKATVAKFVGYGKRNIRYIFEGRQGKSHALNTGIKAAKGEMLAFTDDDVLIDPDWLLNIKKTFDEHDCVGIGGKIIPVIYDKKPSWLNMDTDIPFMNVLGSFDLGEECCELNTPTYGANMSFRKEVFINHGLFRLDLGPIKGNAMGRGEDTEISMRLLAQGEKLMYAPDAIVYHRVQKEKLKKKSFQKSYYNYGRFNTKAERKNLPEKQIYYFGIPRNLYKRLFSKWLDWFFTLDSKQRMCKKLEYYEFLGRAAEYIDSRNDPQPSTIKMRIENVTLFNNR